MKKKILWYFFLLLLISCQKDSPPKLNFSFKTSTGEIPLPEFEKGVGPMDYYSLDYDRDGDEDFLLTTLALPFTIPGTPAPILFFENKNNEVFENKTKEVLGTLEMVHARHMLHQDFNQDGNHDIFISGHGSDVTPFPGEHSRLLIKKEGNRYHSTLKRGLPDKKTFNFYASSGQFDGDGGLELFLNILSSHDNPEDPIPVLLSWSKKKNKFVKNQDFQEVVKRLSLGKYMTSLLHDLDGDGNDELILGARDGVKIKRDLIIKKIGDDYKTFRLPPRYYNKSWGTVNIRATDLDNDGKEDIIVSTHNFRYTKGALQIYFQKENFKFETDKDFSDASYSEGSWYPWISIADINQDGLKDILACPRRIPDKSPNLERWFKLYLQTSPGKFEDIAPALPKISKHALTHCQFLPSPDKEAPALIFIEHHGKFHLLRPEL